MTLSEFWLQFKNKGHQLTPAEIAHIEGFSKGFDMGLMMSSEVDKRVKDKIKQDAISEALARLHGNHKTIN